MRARLILSAATAAIVLAGPLAAEPVAENVTVVAAKKVEAASVVDPKKEPAKTSMVGDKKVAAITVSKPKPKSVPTSLRATINLSAQTMTVTEHGAIKHVWKISSGRRGYYTPNGNFRPQWMTRMHYSRKYNNSPMPHSVFFHRGYAIHATYYTGALGRPASHGCIRLSPSNAKKFYRLVSQHGKASTRISIHGQTPYVVAKKKPKKKYTASNGMGFGFWGSPQPTNTYKKSRKSRKRKYSYNAPAAFAWPGDY